MTFDQCRKICRRNITAPKKILPVRLINHTRLLTQYRKQTYTEVKTPTAPQLSMKLRFFRGHQSAASTAKYSKPYRDSAVCPKNQLLHNEGRKRTFILPPDMKVYFHAINWITKDYIGAEKTLNSLEKQRQASWLTCLVFHVLVIAVASRPSR